MSESLNKVLTPKMRIDAINQLLDGKLSAKLALANKVVVIARGLSQHLSLIVQEYDPRASPKIFNINKEGSYVGPLGQASNNQITENYMQENGDAVLLQLVANSA